MKSPGNSASWGQPEIRGPPKDIPNFAYAKFGEMLGFQGIFVDSPDRPASAWQETLSSDRPVVLEVKIDPNVALLPRTSRTRKLAPSCRRWQRATEARAA